jgi:hypothetical protein
MLSAREKTTTWETRIYTRSAVTMVNSFKDTKYTGLILRQYHFVRDDINSKRYGMLWIDNEYQMVDIGTKNNSGYKHIKLIEQMMDIGTKNNPGSKHIKLIEQIHTKMKDQQRQIQEG